MPLINVYVVFWSLSKRGIMDIMYISGPITAIMTYCVDQVETSLQTLKRAIGVRIGWEEY